MKTERLAYLYAILAVLCWSTVSTAFKLALRIWTPLGLLCFSSLVAFLFLLVYRLAGSPPSSKSILSNLKASVLPGLLNPFLYYFILFAAYDRLRAQEAQVLNYTWAIVLPLAAVIFLGQKFRVRDLIALYLSFFAVVMISTRGNFLQLSFDNLPGSILAVSSSLVWAAYWILNMKDTRTALDKLCFNFLNGFIAISLFLFISHHFGTAIPLFKTTDALFWEAALSVVYIGIFEMGLTFVLWLKALELASSAARISNLIFITPFISMLFISLILKESIHISTLLGLVLIIGGSFIQNYKPGSRKLK